MLIPIYFFDKKKALTFSIIFKNTRDLSILVLLVFKFGSRKPLKSGFKGSGLVLA